MTTLAVRYATTAAVSALVLTLFVVTTPMTGCGGPPEEPAPIRPEPIRNDQLDVTVSLDDEPWSLATNSDDQLQFRPTHEGLSGLATASVGPYETGVNLIEALSIHRANIERRAGGAYAGAQELSGPLGTAFYSRGMYDDNGTMVEETCILGLHPRASRRLDLCYSYPAGEDSAARVEALIALFGAFG